MVSRGEVWLVRLEAIDGRDVPPRPYLVVSPPEIHDHMNSVIVAPLTIGTTPASFRIDVRFNNTPHKISPDQVRTIDKHQLLRSLGTVDKKAVSATLATLRDMFAE